MEIKCRIYFLLTQYTPNKWLVRIKKNCGLVSVGLRAFSEASGGFADETVAFKLLPACNRLDITTKIVPLCFRLEAKMIVEGVAF